MKKALMLGAVLLAVAGVKTASAAEYGFYTSSGGAYCDGVKYSGKAPAAGTHVYDQVYCIYPDAYLGGFSGSVKALGAGQWFTFPVSNATGDGAPQTEVFTFYINPKALTWQLYYASTDNTTPFTFLNSGTLQKGKPFAAGGKQIHDSVIHASLLKAGLIKAK